MLAEINHMQKPIERTIKTDHMIKTDGRLVRNRLAKPCMVVVRAELRQACLILVAVFCLKPTVD
jgi:hypothetical protein